MGLIDWLRGATRVSDCFCAVYLLTKRFSHRSSSPCQQHFVLRQQSGASGNRRCCASLQRPAPIPDSRASRTIGIEMGTPNSPNTTIASTSATQLSTNATDASGGEFAPATSPNTRYASSARKKADSPQRRKPTTSSRGGTHDFSNVMGLCKSCHSCISTLDGDRWRNGRSAKREHLG